MSGVRMGLTGGSGVLGRHLRRTWPDADWSLFTGDIRDRKAVNQWVQASLPLDGLIHFSALVPVAQVAADPVRAFETNVAGTLYLLEAVHTATNSGETAPWIFFASTSHIYAATSIPIAEDGEQRPLTTYGATKMQAEYWVEHFAEHHALSVCTGRIFSSTAPGQSDMYFVPAMIKRIREIALEGTIKARNLSAMRDFISADDICAAVRHLFHIRATGPFNVATGEPHSLRTVLETLADCLGRRDIRIVSQGGDGGGLLACVDRIKATGWQPRRSLRDMLEEMCRADEN
jgi:nucleoside-diphosphate-sugar epimerase